MQLVSDPQVLLTKNKIIKSVIDIFAVLSEDYKSAATVLQPESLIAVMPKISRGENYNGLPWVMLDYPRNFSKQNNLAVRTFFWWGNYFTITLHLSGQYMYNYVDVVNKAVEQGKLEGWMLQTEGDEWQHAVDNPYQTVVQGTRIEPSMPFVKLAKKIPLQEWDSIRKIMLDNFNLIITILTD